MIAVKLRGISTDIRLVAGLILATVMLNGCRTGVEYATPTAEPLFIPPTANPADSYQVLTPESPLPTRQADCQDQLQFVDDLTVPDGSEVAPGERITKRWLVVNQGSCSWDQTYSLQLISGLALGAETRQQLYPARQGTEFVLEIIFTAPESPGRYNSWWQAYDPDGGRFGDPVYVEIAVVEP
jgi:hypothetical protein